MHRTYRIAGGEACPGHRKIATPGGEAELAGERPAGGGEHDGHGASGTWRRGNLEQITGAGAQVRIEEAAAIVGIVQLNSSGGARIDLEHQPFGIAQDEVHPVEAHQPGRGDECLEPVLERVSESWWERNVADGPTE